MLSKIGFALVILMLSACGGSRGRFSGTTTVATANNAVPGASANLSPAPVDSSKSAWDNIATLSQNITTLFQQVTQLQVSKGGSVVIHWGSGALPANVPSGTELVFAGYGFGSYYGHARNGEIDCFQGSGTGPAWNGNYADVRYPVATGGASLLPPGIPETKLLACAAMFVPGTTYTVKGSGECPANWSVVYSGFLMGAYYTHTGGGTNSLCVDPTGFDSRLSHASPYHYSYVYGTHLTEGVSQVGSAYTGQYVKCAVCVR